MYIAITKGLALIETSGSPCAASGPAPVALLGSLLEIQALQPGRSADLGNQNLCRGAQ